MKKALIIAGEASADLYAGNIVKSFKKRVNDINFFSIGGEKLRDAGAEILCDYKDISVVGAVEVFFSHKKNFEGYKTNC